QSLHCPFSYAPPPATAIYTLSLHAALPICRIITRPRLLVLPAQARQFAGKQPLPGQEILWTLQGPLAELLVSAGQRISWPGSGRSEEHTSELQSRENLVCRLLLEKKKKSPT